jgi:hypothetical protein
MPRSSFFPFARLKRFLLRHGLLFEFGQRFVPGGVELDDGNDVLRGPVERERRGEIVGEEDEDQRHEHEHALLHRVTRLGRDVHLPDHGQSHENGQDVDGKT